MDMAGGLGKKIVLISSGQPSLNPRLVKEADTLAEAGHEVTVLYAYWNNWGTEHDKQLLPTKKWKAIRAGGDPVEKRFTYLITRIRLKLGTYFYRWFQAGWLSQLVIARAAWSLRGEAQKHDADIYIAHNLGALPAAIRAAKKRGAKCGFDAEDFHRFETTDDKNDTAVKLKIAIEDKYLPQTAYLTASSPLIADAYKKLYPLLSPVTILNVFPADARIKAPAVINTGNISLFWFSQTIGVGRGLEDVLAALEILKDYPFELHLLGHLPPDTAGIFAGYGARIFLHEPVPAAEIPLFASQFDIGLAVESKVPFNRNICLTNKIFTYMQSGLAVVASDTAAQQALLAQYLGVGKTYPAGNPKQLADTLLYYHEHRDALLAAKQSSLRAAAQELNWETESGKFLSLVERLLEN